MATSDYIPIEKRAKGKSNVFKFVTLRNPQSPSVEDNERLFVNHPNLSSSVFIKEADPSKKIAFEKLQEISDGFKPYNSVEDVKKINPDLYVFADWLFRNKSNIDVKTIGEIATAPSIREEELFTLWDNLFYFTINSKSQYISEAILMVIISNNFIIKYRDANLIKSNEDLKKLASAKVVFPKIILSRPKRSDLDSKFSQRNIEFVSLDEEEILAKIDNFNLAVKELKEYNEEFFKNLSVFEIKDGRTEVIDEEGYVGISNLSYQEVIQKSGNPLDETQLLKFVSEKTVGIIKDLNLESTSQPIQAIERIESKISELNKELFSNKKLSNKQIVAGGSILKSNNRLPIPSDFVEGCFASIGTQENILVDDTLKSIRSTIFGTGLSGGVSTNSFTGLGSIAFQILKTPSPGTSFVVGLSSQEGTTAIQNIDFGLKMYSYYSSTGTLYNKVQAVRADGSDIEDSFTLKAGDWFKISRAQTFSGGYEVVFQRYRIINTSGGSSIQIANMANDDIVENTFNQSLKIAFKFNQLGQAFFNLHIHPCVDDDDDSNNDTQQCSGITNLGVSDYMRVEQEVCCYTAGEVSHIENIMQGEYKERSTRRLRRQETTTTFETENTTEKLRDTTTTDRYEMEQESSDVIQEDSAFDIGVSISAKYGPVRLTSDSGFASASSSSEANSQAVSYAKEVSSRALDRVVQRVREERINKVIEEFEENNLHGLDNTNNSESHVTGLYRWVDKVYKNQVVNYGKRLSFEFMIPEPAKFHLWAMANSDAGIDLEEPEDPREHGLSKHTSISESNYAQWASAYDAKVDSPPALYKTLSQSYSETNDHEASYSQSNNDITIPEGYKATDGVLVMGAIGKGGWSIQFALGSSKKSGQDGNLGNLFNPIYDFQDVSDGTLPFSFTTRKVFTMNINVTINCSRKPETLEKWKIETFNKIMEAYRQKKAAYDNAVAEAKAQNSLGIQIQGNNPLFNRTIEQQELKKNCLKWLEVQVGNSHYGSLNVCSEANDMPSMNTSEDLACYSQKAKFFEQAFDWDIMSYLFYPYFWGKKCSWKEIYKLDDNDPVFRGFLQAGMARVVVPVKPNYEQAVMYYLETGDVWNGGEVPVPEDPLYVSIVDELAEQDPVPVGDPWETRIPTSLNILQKDNAAVAGDGLPCNCTDYEADGTGGSTLSGGTDEATTN